MTTADAPDRHLAQQRVKRLATAFVRPVIRQWWRYVAAGVVGVVIGVVAQLTFSSWWTASLVNVVAAAAAIGLATLPLRERRLRDAMEVYTDHLQLERADWKLMTGTSLPTSLGGMQRWLREHPDDRYGRVPILVGLGRFDEADAELAAHPAKSVAEAYRHELIRQETRVFAGEEPDLTVLLRDVPSLNARSSDTGACASRSSRHTGWPRRVGTRSPRSRPAATYAVRSGAGHAGGRCRRSGS